MNEYSGLAQYDQESGIWRIVELCEEPKTWQRAAALEAETGESVAITRYGKKDIPQIDEQVWIN